MTKNNTYNKILIKYMIFRSLANLTAHKRSYCLERYEDDDDDNDDNMMIIMMMMIMIR